ncbi:MAG: hypothetical protein ABEH61_04845 [Haloarculaceae archaeon]
MVDISLPFGDDDGANFDAIDAFVPEHLPEPDAFLDGHDVLTGDDHVAFHTLTRELFEERGVYDMTFDYNLARLNLDPRHPNAGYRYADESGDSGVLRAEFTPTTPFCPQTHTLTIGSFRAWNGLADRHDYNLVRVRSHPMHHDSEAINEQLAEIEAVYRETGEMPDPAEPGDSGGGIDTPPTGSGTEIGEPTESPDAPF